MGGFLAFLGGLIGAVIGYFTPVGPYVGFAIGSSLFSIAYTIFAGTDTVVTKGPRLSDLTVMVSTYGQDIPKVYGTARISGNVFWATDFVEDKKIRHLDGDAEYWEFTYYGNFALALCEGTIIGIRKIFLDGKLWVDASASLGIGSQAVTSTQRGEYWEVFTGAPSQIKSTYISSFLTDANTPAYRDTAYILFKELPLKDYGNRFPQVTAEVVASGYRPAGNYFVDPCNGDYTAMPNLWDVTLGNSGTSAPWYQGPNLYARWEVVGSASATYGCGAGVLRDVDCYGRYTFDFEYRQQNNWWNDDPETANNSVCEFSITQSNPIFCNLSTCYRAIEENGYGVDSKLSFFLRTPASGKFTVKERINGSWNQIFHENYTWNAGSFDKVRIIVDFTDLWFEVWDMNGTPTQVGSRTSFNATLLDYIGTTFTTCIHFHNYSTQRYVDFRNFNFVHGDLNTALEIDMPTLDGQNYGLVRTNEGHLVTCNASTKTISLHQGVSDYLISQFECPNPRGSGTVRPYSLTQWNNDLYVGFIVTDGGNDYSYISRHVNYSASTHWIQELFFSPGGQVGGIAFNQTGNLFVANRADNNIYKYDSLASLGVTPTFSLVGIGATYTYNNMYGIAFDTDFNLLEANSGDGKIYKRQGASSILLDTLDLTHWAPNSLADIYYDRNDEILWTTKRSEDLIVGLDGFTEDVKRLDFIVTIDFDLQEVVEDICDSVGINSTMRDTSDLAGISGRGYVRSSTMPARRVLEPLMSVYNFDVAEYDHKINFVLRGAASQATITESEIAAYEHGDSAPDKMQITKVQEIDFPRELELSYMSLVNNYQTGTARSIRQHTNSKKVSKIEFPISMSHSEGKQAAEILHNKLWTERTRYAFTTSLKYLWLAPSDVVVVDGYKMRVEQMSIKGNLLQIEGPQEEDANYTAEGDTEDPDVDPPVIKEPTVPSSYVMLDIPVISDLHDNRGFYIAAHGYGNSSFWGTGDWNGVNVWISSDGVTYSSAEIIVNESIVGSSTNALSNANSFVFDRANTVNVRLASTNFTLPATTTEIDVLNGANMAALGDDGRWEIIAFCYAKLEADGSYTLSTLLRGLKGTEWATGQHQAYDLFVMLDTNNLVRLTSAATAVPYYYKVVGISVPPSLFTGVQFTNNSVGLETYAPTRISGSRDASMNLTITWKRRARINHEWDDYQDVPLDETLERYELDIMDGASVKRAVTGLTSPTYTYTIGDQTDDWGGAKQPCSVNIYQLSDEVGRGYVGSASI